MNKTKLEFITDQVIHLKGEQVYSYVRDRIAFHKENGHKIFFISGSPDFLRRKNGGEETEHQAAEEGVDGAALISK